MSKSNLALGFAVILVIALAPAGMGLELQVTGTSNKTFNIDNSYNVIDNKIYVENSSLAEPTIIFNGNVDGVNPLFPPRLTTAFVSGSNNLNFTENINYFELNVTYSIKNGYQCLQNSDCDSNACNADYAGGIMYCAQSSFRCVHNTGSLPATQYNDGATDGGYKCSSGTWKANDGYTCAVGGDCYSGYCRNDSLSIQDTFCAASSTNCVRNTLGIPVTQYADGSSDGAGNKCNSGIWKADDGYSCSTGSDCGSGYCRTDHTGGNKYCAQSSSSCVHYVFGSQANQYFDGQSNGNYVCSSGIWKVGNGYACSLDSNCTSGYCHTDFTSPTDKYCAQGNSRCVHLNFGTQATQYFDGNTKDNYICDSGTWKVDDGYPCAINANCYSGYCRSDFNPGLYCAEDAWKCVHMDGSLPADQHNFWTKVDGHRCKLNGVWGGLDADGDGVADYIDKCPNTPAGCNTGPGADDINAATGCPNKPINPYNIKDDPSSICIGSSLPIDPVRSVCLEQNIADKTNVSFFLRNTTGEYAANDPLKCSLELGTFGWHDISDGRFYCVFDVGDNLKIGTYDLVAKYTIPSVPAFADTFRYGFTVSNLCSLDTKCLHGGHIQNQVALSGGVLTFDMPWITDGGTYITCVGANGTISNVAQYIAQCSDGASSGTVNPGLLVWVYDPSNPGNYLTGGYSDNQFQDGTFNMIPKPRRADVLSSTLGYRWTSNLAWTGGASTNDVDDFYTFNLNGGYLVYLDYINNFCDSPDYIHLLLS